VTGIRRSIGLIVAVCVAFAVGIALGNGPLQGAATGPDPHVLASKNSGLADVIDGLRKAAMFDKALNDAVARRLLRHRLTGRSVAVFVLPGVAGSTVPRYLSALRQAGGSPVVTATISSGFIDPGRKTYVASVAANAAKGLDDLSSGRSPDTYERIGALIGRAYTGHRGRLAFDKEASRLDGQLRGSTLVSLSGTPSRRGSLVLVLAPGAHVRDGFSTASRVISVALIHALTRTSDGVVVAAPPTAAQPGGLLAALTAAPGGSRHRATVDVSGSSAGTVAAVYALAAAASGEGGSYGVLHGRTVMPPGLAMPRR
jgi:Copper transport outer membrane protein, MctB